LLPCNADCVGGQLQATVHLARGTYGYCLGRSCLSPPPPKNRTAGRDITPEPFRQSCPSINDCVFHMQMPLIWCLY
jgi:hypothetical protein